MLKENFKLAMDALLANKFRSILSALGIFIGVFSIILILTMMDGFRYYVHNTFNSFGSTSVYVSKLPLIITSFDEFMRLNKRQPIKYQYYEKIQERSLYASHVAPVINTGKEIKVGSESERVRVVGSTEQEPFIDDIEVEHGRFYTESDVKSRSKVCIIGWDIKDRFFPQIDIPIGQEIKIDGYSFRVIGISKRKGSFFGQSMDNNVYIPITSLPGNIRNFRGIMIGVGVEDPKDLPKLKDELTGIMRQVRKIEPTAKSDFSIFKFNDFNVIFDQVTQVAYLTIFGISLISLIVGGIGIMNIMVVTVTERRKEIGIRKSLGAKRNVILSQFLFESIVITSIGGIIAIIAGVAGALLGLSAMDIDMPITAKPFIVGILFCVFVGVLSGFLPALKASKLKPVEALNM